MKLHADVWGNGPNLVMLHGWGMNNAVWSELRPGLTSRYRVTCLELPGHGESGYDPLRYRLDDWVDACLDAAPPHARWVGWSLGGQVALRLAIRHPERVERLVMISSSPRFVRGPGWDHAMLEQTLRQFAATLEKNHRQTLIRFLSLQVQGDEQARETLRLLRRELDLRPAPNDQALEHGLNLLLNTDLRDQLHLLRCPNLWLYGDRDTLTPPESMDDLRQLGVPNASFALVPYSAHAPFLSHLPECQAYLDEFLEEAER